MDPTLLMWSDILLNWAFLQKTVMITMTSKRELASLEDPVFILKILKK